MKIAKILQFKYYFLTAVVFIGLILVLFINPIPQDQQYHRFADTNSYLSMANFWNVVSNLPLIIAGLIGLVFTLRKNSESFSIKFPQSYMFFFAGIALTGAGSAFYHLTPNNDTLFWDRLPLTMAFMSFLTIIITEFISFTIGQRFLYPLLIIGIASVVYWHISENMGAGDLRFYILIQFLPLILIPIILLFFKEQSNLYLHIWLILAAYVLAKFFELMDNRIYLTFGFISGHTLKHIAASFAPIILIRGMKKRIH